MLVQYLLDAGDEVVIPGVDGAADHLRRAPVEPVALALDPGAAGDRADLGPRRGSRARKGNFVGEQFMAWFLKEQLEEVSSMTALLKTVERAAAVEHPAGRGLPGPERRRRGQREADAPPAAGGAL